MPLSPAITDIEQLKDRPMVGDLLTWRADAIQGARFDRDELTIYVAREAIREACARLKSQGLTDFLSDLTCADFYPREPRFEVAYHLLATKRHWNRSPLCGLRQISLSASSSIFLAFVSLAIPICAALCCRRTGKVILCARTIQWKDTVNGPLERQSGAGPNSRQNHGPQHGAAASLHPRRVAPVAGD